MAIDIKSLNHTQLNDLIQKAQARQDELQKEKVTRVREKVQALLKAEGLSFEDVFGAGASVRGGGKRRGTGSVAPKYRNPADPEQTWSGRGKRPRWFNDALKAGKKEKDMAV
ncbi:H-NS histone family protein [Dyella acidisoli]|uniref:DNA-binding protein n=1 Tax=Dyella acidisoli TaxID=1867834 RepID=A0ABQ5XP02_9GAMM|nr:H-NS histone family protein [Dyella acidisoli]GLQ92301.1 DNA-binding protein [Dyella acidisoli]